MPIYEYECQDRHRTERFFRRHTDAPDEMVCGAAKCRARSHGKLARRVISRLARFDIERDWNEKANLYRRDPYTQSKAQLENVRRETLERVERDCDRPTSPITEEAIQIGASEIDKQNKRGPVDSEARIVERQRRQIQKSRRAAK